jgi:membrane-bound metal-dependent hydrolase YbcI (DUF457 family)
VDFVTHALASVAVVRGCFPRAAKQTMVFAVFAGVVADVDWLSNYFGPSAFLEWQGTYTHSILSAVLLSALLPAGLLLLFAIMGGGVAIPLGLLRKGEALPVDVKSKRKLIARRLFPVAFAAPLLAALLHLAMDACQSGGVTLLWPFSGRRFAMDWLPSFDPWILSMLIVALGIPELLRLVSAEIGASENNPRGQAGAIIGLALLSIYIGVRATLHSNVISLLNSRTYHGELPRRAGAFPEAISLLTWHGIVETESALHELVINAGFPAGFDSGNSVEVYKPEPSAVLDAARHSAVAGKFLAIARFPKASVEKTETGYRVELRDLRYSASGPDSTEIEAIIELDPAGKVTTEALVWVRKSRGQ